MKFQLFKNVKAPNMVCTIRNKDKITGERTGKIQCIHVIFFRLSSDNYFVVIVDKLKRGAIQCAPQYTIFKRGYIMELLGLIIGYTFIACLFIALCLPLVICFTECWKKTVLMLAMFAGIGILSVGFAVLVNMLAAIVFCGSMVGLTIGAIWDRNAVI